ncbi:asparagine synthase (glutamine-hydrolyzing) [Dissulfurispira sp.]|uniref:asparagine synthase (glutamine-hydrolyzing) n=1 Tax=Dissulfurispira sp. TaxID=2817609 RepID=UPI002FDA7DDD
MCGIFGYTGNPYSSKLLDQMGGSLLHRGPDDIGVYVNKNANVFFGLRRLSIIDLETGHQPLSNENNTIWLACNGEIYNYIELREDLIKKGHMFRTHSDVEVLLHLYEEHGLDFLANVNGMFGIVLYDITADRLVLARDRLGIKPLYYAWNGRQLAFASEVKSILLCPWISRGLDWHAISMFLHLLYVPAPKTCFDKIEKLESGSIAILEGNKLRFQKYWDMSLYLNPSPSKNISLEDASDHLHSLLSDACRLQLRSDVPVGAFLSGGVDSSAVVSLANFHKPLSMDTFTVHWQNANEKIDERGFAREVSNLYGTVHHEIAVSFEDFERLLPLLVWHMDEPNADGAYVPTYIISKFARQKCKVILTGSGGDELFAGYQWYRNKKMSLKGLLGQSIDMSAYLSRAFVFPWKLIMPMYEPGVASKIFTDYYGRVATDDRVNAHTACDLQIWLQDNILLLTDKMSMAASIEARVPLLDHRIVEFVLGLPSSYKLTASNSKVILKKALGNYLPPSILTRRKDGFGAPIISWMYAGFMEICLKLLERGELLSEGIISKRHIRRLKYLLHVRRSWSWALWILLNLELWLRFSFKPSPRPDGVGISDL